MNKHDRKRRARKKKNRQTRQVSARVPEPPPPPEYFDPDDLYSLVGAPRKPRPPLRQTAVAAELPREPEVLEMPELRFLRD